MAERSPMQSLVPSLLDRLTSEPGSMRRGSGQSLARLKQSVAYDLQRLLNTRMSWLQCASHQKQFARS
jgi:predicted component of type VI protein secretion system